MLSFLIQFVDFKQLIITILLLLFVYFAVFIAVAVDLWSGLRRSRRLGIQLKSKGLRSSLRKFNDYMLFVILASIVDLLLYAFSVHDLLGLRSVPYLTLFVGLIPIGIEAYSVYEKSDKKRKKDINIALNNLIELAKTKGDTTEILKRLDALLPKGVEQENEQPIE